MKKAFFIRRKTIKPGGAPKTRFARRKGGEAEAAYAYGELHPLWEA